VNLNEAIVVQVGAEGLADGRLHAENALGGGCAQIDNAAVLSRAVRNDNAAVTALTLNVLLRDFGFVDGER
jgi:hypothetical protein